MRYLWQIIVLWLYPVITAAQIGRLFTTDGQLSSSMVNQVLRDKHGMVWVATEDGLNRYDGTKFTVYRHATDDSTSIATNQVQGVYEDKKGRMYVTTNQGIQLYDHATDRFSPVARWSGNGKPFINNTYDVKTLPNGEVWASGHMLVQLSIFHNELRINKAPVSFADVHTGRMALDNKGRLWVVAADKGVYCRTNKGKEHFYANPLPDMTLTDICATTDGRIYACDIVQGILMAYDEKKECFSILLHTGLPLKSLCETDGGRLLIGTDGYGVKWFDSRYGNTLNDYPIECQSLNPRSLKVHSIFRDCEKNIWLAIYQKGIMMLPNNDSGFKYIGYKSNLHNVIGQSCITTLWADSDGRMWIGTDGDGIYRIDSGMKQAIHYKPQEKGIPPTILRIYRDSRGQLWIGSFTRGMGRFDEKSGKCVYMPLITPTGKTETRVFDFAEDAHGRLWIATMGSGLFMFNPQTGKVNRDTTINKVLMPWIDCLLYCSRGKLYVGTHDGLRLVELHHDKVTATSLSHGYIVYCLHEGTDGQIWIGTSEGVMVFNPQLNTFKQMTALKETGLHGSVYGIRSAKNGDLWISSNSGLYRYRPQQNAITSFFAKDGLQGNEFSKNASATDSEGRLWFGGTNGITVFHPHDITVPHTNWHVRISDLYLYDRPVRAGMMSGGKAITDTATWCASHFEFAHNDNTFTIELTTKEMNRPERLTFAYSFDSDPWITLPIGTNRLTFNKLSPGRHTLCLKANNSDIRKVEIIVRKAWWNTAWAWMAYTLIVLVILMTIAYQVWLRIKAHRAMIRHKHGEEINEAKLQFFTNISHEIRTPMSLIIAPLRQLMLADDDPLRLSRYHTIYRNAERIMTLVGQLMDIRKLDHGKLKLRFAPVNLASLIADVCESFKELASGKNICLTFSSCTNETIAYVDEEHFDKIVVNLISNALKYTPHGGYVKVTLRCLDNHYEIAVDDNGAGIAPEERDRIFDRFYQIQNNNPTMATGSGVGLHLVRQLVILHHGSITVEGHPDGTSGSRFTVSIPKGTNHLRKEEIVVTEVKPKREVAHAPLPQIQEIKKDKTRVRHRVLIVEDDEEIRLYLKQELRQRFYVDESANGQEALDMMSTKTYAAVLSDVMMPVMDGTTLCRKIKTNPRLNTTAVVLLTAKNRDEDHIKGMDVGADAYLTKPFNMEVLMHTMLNVVAQYERIGNALSGRQSLAHNINKIEIESPDEQLMARVMKSINAHLSDSSFSVAMMATEVGLSRVHLYRKLKELTNQPARDLIRNTRLQEAARLLTEKRLPLSSIAYEVGFEQESHFSSAFKDYFGISPSEYRERNGMIP